MRAFKQKPFRSYGDWNVDGKVSGITHDNAYNITKVIKKI